MACTVTADLFLSVDGWAGSEGLPGYFGYLGPELEQWIGTELAAPQRVVLGRRTYELLAGPPDQPADGGSSPLSQPETVVFSRTLQQVGWPNARICHDDVVGQIRRMKADGDVPLRTMGSLSLVRQLLAAGLVDRLRLMMFPLLAGDSGRESGLADVASADLELVGHRVLDGRVLLVEYRPTGRDIPRV
jgi:dihydrofolate reductase